MKGKPRKVRSRLLSIMLVLMLVLSLAPVYGGDGLLPNDEENGYDVLNVEDEQYIEIEDEQYIEEDTPALSELPLEGPIGITPASTRTVTIVHGGGGYLQGNNTNDYYVFDVVHGQSFNTDNLLLFSTPITPYLGSLINWIVTDVTYSGAGILPVVNEPFSFVDPITAGDITVEGDWIFRRNVTFDLNGGNIGVFPPVDPVVQVWDGQSISSTSNPAAVMPQDPEMTGEDAPEFSRWVIVGPAESPRVGTTFTNTTQINGYSLIVQAVWDVERTITFDLAGGTIDGNSTTPPRVVREGQSINQATGAVMPVDPIRVDGNNVPTHRFGGWRVTYSPDGVTPNASPTVAFTGAIPVSGGNITVTALWTPYRTVTFDPGSLATIPGETPPANLGDTVTRRVLDGAVIGTANFPNDPIHQDGRMFSHWEVTTSPTDVTPNEGHTLAATGIANQIRGGDITVTAIWRADRTITFNPGATNATIPGAAAGANVTRSVRNDTALNDDANDDNMPQRPTRPGYTFDGWRVTDSPSGVLPNESPTVHFTGATAVSGGDITVTAQWIESRTITFNPGATNATIPGAAAGATVTRNVANATAINNVINLDAAGEQLTIPGNPTRPGHVFMGWRVTDSPTGVTPIVDPDAPFTDATVVTGGNITVTAQWAVARTVTFVPASGSGIGSGLLSGGTANVVVTVADGTYLNDPVNLANPANDHIVNRGPDNDNLAPWPTATDITGTVLTFTYRWDVIASAPVGTIPQLYRGFWGSTVVTGGNITVEPVFTVLSVRFDTAGGTWPDTNNTDNRLVPVNAWSSIATTPNPASVMPPDPELAWPGYISGVHPPSYAFYNFSGWQIIESHGGARPYVGTFFDEHSIIANGTVVVQAIWTHPLGTNPLVGVLFEERRFDGTLIRDYMVRVHIDETLNNTPNSMIPAMPTVYMGREFRGWVVSDPMGNPSLIAGAPFTGDELITVAARPTAVIQTSWAQQITFLPGFTGATGDPITRMVLASNGQLVDPNRPTNLPTHTHPPFQPLPTVAQINALWGDRVAAGYAFDGWRVTVGCGTSGPDAIAVGDTFTVNTVVPFFSNDIQVEASWRRLSRVNFVYAHPAYPGPAAPPAAFTNTTHIVNASNQIPTATMTARNPAVNTNHSGYIVHNPAGTGTQASNWVVTAVETGALLGGAAPTLNTTRFSGGTAAAQLVTVNDITVTKQWQRLSRVSFEPNHPLGPVVSGFANVNNVQVQMNGVTAANRHTVGTANMPAIALNTNHSGYVFEGWRVTSTTQHTTGVTLPVLVGGVAPNLVNNTTALIATTTVTGGDITVTGQWRRLSIVEFISEGNGTDAPTSRTVLATPAAQVNTVGAGNMPYPGTVPLRGFANWRITAINPNPSGGEVLINGNPAVLGDTFFETTTVTGGDIIVTAAFTGISRTITFDPVNGTWATGGGGSSPRNANFEDGAPLTEDFLNQIGSPLPPAGQIFDRWVVSAHTNPGTPTVGSLLYVGIPVSGGNVTVTAQYLPLRLVHLNLDGGNINGNMNPPAIGVGDGRSLTCPNMPGMPPIPTGGGIRAGYIFTHWEVVNPSTATQPVLGTTFEGDTIVSGGNITIIARWELARTVTFDLAGGNIDGDTANVVRGVADGMSLTHPNMPGMPDDPEWFGRVFQGWEVTARTATATAPTIGDDFEGTTIVSGGNITVTAQWHIPVGHLSGHVLREDDQTTPIPGADVFVMNQHGNIVATTIAGINGEFTITGLAPGTYTVFASHTGFNTNFSVPNPVVLTAAEGAAANVYLAEGPYYYLLLVNVVRDNDVGPQTRVTGAAVSFEGTGLTNPASADHFWALPMTAPNVGNATASAIGYQTGTATLTATHWGTSNVLFELIVLEPEPDVVVTFIPVANGSLVGGTPNVVEELPWDGGVLSSAQIPTPQPDYGYHFAGWFTAATGGTTFDLTVTITEDTNVYARFAPNPPVLVTFIPVANGSLAGGTPNVVTELPWNGGVIDVATQRPTPQPNSNFHFVGWFTAATGGTVFDFTATITENTNVYARFALNNDDPGDIPGGPSGPTVIQQPPVPLGPFVDEHISYVRGFPDGSFRPGNSITRAEISMILFRLLDSQAKYQPQANRFGDIQANSWYAQAVNYLASRNIVTGFPDGNFHPNAPITRAELTAMMSRFFEMQGNGSSRFSDVANAHWAIAYINNAHNRGWITGFDDGTFRPNNATSRAEAVTLINRVLNRTPNPETISHWVEGLTFTDRDTLFNDITHTHWAFYQIKEAAIEHEYEVDAAGRELWTSIDIPWLNTFTHRH